MERSMFSIVDFKMLKNCSFDDIFVQFVWNYTYSSSFDFGENSTWVSYPPKRNKKCPLARSHRTSGNETDKFMEMKLSGWWFQPI